MSTRAAAGIAALLLITPTLAGAETLRLGSDVWPPFTDLPDKPRVAIELVQTALERAGIDTDSVVRSDFGDVIQQIRDGQLDGSAAVWRSPEREKFLVYSRPYLENRLVLVGRKGSDTSADSLAALKGKRIAIVASYAYGGAVGPETGPVFVKGSSDGDNLQSLLRGDVDYVLVDDLVVVHLLRRNPEKATRLLQIGATPIVQARRADAESGVEAALSGQRPPLRRLGPSAARVQDPAEEPPRPGAARHRPVRVPRPIWSAVGSGNGTLCRFADLSSD